MTSKMVLCDRAVGQVPRQGAGGRGRCQDRRVS